MLLIKSEKCKRIACFLLSVLLAFCIIMSPICESRAYAAAGVVTVIGVGALLVIGTILIGLGIEVTDLNLFDSLCRQVHEKLQAFAVVRDEIFLNIKDGIQYVSKELVLNIAKILFELQSFTPNKVRTLSYKGLTLDVYDNVLESYWGGLNNMYRFKDGKIPTFSTFKSIPYVFNSATDFYFNIGDSGFKYRCTGTFDNPRFYVHFLDGTYTNLGANSNNIFTFLSLSYPFVALIDNRHYLAMLFNTSVGVNFSIDSRVLPSSSISAETEKVPWAVSNPPSISADTGAITFPADTPWAKNPAVSLPGISAPSIPITVPSDLGGLKDMPQTDVMTGNPAGTANPPIAIDKEIDKALEDMKMPPTLIEKFPFSIPFDIFRAMQGLVAPPVAPSFVIPLKAPAYGIDYEFRMDWSKFDIVISIVRWGTFLVFLLYLAGATKKLIWG